LPDIVLRFDGPGALPGGIDTGFVRKLPRIDVDDFPHGFGLAQYGGTEGARLVIAESHCCH